MASFIQRCVVYLSSSGHVSPSITHLADHLGQSLAQNGCGVVFGGMDLGPMGTLANAAMAASGSVIGIVPKKLRESAFVHQSITKSVLVDTLAERKRLMFDLSQAAIVLPGGFGTLDEAADILYWATLGLHNKPLIFINPNGFWDDILFLYNRVLAAYPSAQPFMRAVASVEEAINVLKELDTEKRALTVPYQHLPSLEEEIIAGTDPLVINGTAIRSLTLAVAGLLCKQLNLTQRPIGVVNTGGFYNPLFQYIEKALQEKFITDSCLTLLKQAPDASALLALLESDVHVTVDLTKKWGKAEA